MLPVITQAIRGLFQRSNNSGKAASSSTVKVSSARNTFAGTLLVDADLNVAAHSRGMKQPLACYGLALNAAGLNDFIGLSGLRDHILDVFASGRVHELVVSAPHGARRHWRATLTGSEEGKPKQVLVSLEPCSPVLQFDSDTGHVTWLEADECKRVGWLNSSEAGDVWNVPAVRHIDWQELLIKQLEQPGCEVAQVSPESSASNYPSVRISMANRRG
ncbi:MAG: hypothetical protein M3Y27_03885 [Acidobacteriota bacterium]|nr:hypothetical protein [Acidobacteriota bacterium]